MTIANLILPANAILLMLIFLSPTLTTAADTAVLDIDGRPLSAGTAYYILPVVRGRGGGLTLTPKNSTTQCPLYVAQENQEVSFGLPLKFFPVNYPKQKRVLLSTDFNVVFDASTICVQSTVWRLTLDEATGKRYVGTGGVTGNPGGQTLSNWFKIEKAGTGKYDYKLVFCPTVCNFCKVICGDIGVFIQEDGTRLLGFTDQPLLVMFKKA